MATALTLSGKSTIAKTSVSPKAKYNASNLPPADLKNCSAACRRLVPPSFATPFAPSFVKQTCMRYLGIKSLLQIFEKQKSQHTLAINRRSGWLQTLLFISPSEELRVPPVWPHNKLEGFSMTGEACYDSTNII